MRSAAFERLAAGGAWTTCVVWRRGAKGQPAAIESAPDYPSIEELALVLRVADPLRLALSRVVEPEVALLVTFTVLGDECAIDAPTWLLEVEEGDPVPIAEWFGACQEGLTPAELQAVLDLAPGETYEGDAGAGGLWRVRRIP